MSIQGTEEWFLERLGCATASRFSDALASGKGITRRAYMVELVSGRLSGVAPVAYSNANMLAGIEREPYAKEAYSVMTGKILDDVGFVRHPEHPCGCSPDALVEDDGMVQIKCPLPHTHVEYLLENRLPTAYATQIYGELWITGRQWSDFVSWCPEMPPKLQLFVYRVKRDEARIAEIETGVFKFLDELDALEAQLRGMTIG